MEIKIDLPDDLGPTIERIERSMGAPAGDLIRRAVLAVANVYQTRPFALVQVYQMLESSDAGAYIIKAVKKKRKIDAKPPTGESITLEL